MQSIRALFRPGESENGHDKNGVATSRSESDAGAALMGMCGLAKGVEEGQRDGEYGKLPTPEGSLKGFAGHIKRLRQVSNRQYLIKVCV